MMMAWPVVTYENTYMGGKPSNARKALHALCTAVNEREGALLQTKTQFYKADGTEAADLSLADLENIHAGGSSSYGGQNLERVRQGIIDLIELGVFTDGVNGAVWSVAGVGTEIGASLTTEPQYINEAAYWQKLQDALDLLTHATVELDYTEDTGRTRYYSDAYETGTGFPGPDPDKELAWDNRDENTGTMTLPQLYWEVEITAHPSGEFIAGVTRSHTLEFVVGDYGGSLEGGAFFIPIFANAAGTGGAGPYAEFDWACGGVTGTVTQTDTTVIAGTWEEWASNELALNATTNVTFEITTTEPADAPFAGPTGLIRAFCSKARIYLDLTGDLTDQAA